MTHVITKDTIVLYSKSGHFEVHQIPSATDNVIWFVVWTENANKFGLAVDGPSAQEVLRFCNHQKIQFKAILNTHTHGDHIGINRDLQRNGLLQKIQVYGHEKVKGKIPGITHTLQDNDVISIGPLRIKVLLTEGHINGHVSYLIDEFLFCGDTMFGAGCGYLFDGPPSKMHSSLQRFLYDIYLCNLIKYSSIRYALYAFRMKIQIEYF